MQLESKVVSSCQLASVLVFLFQISHVTLNGSAGFTNFFCGLWGWLSNNIPPPPSCFCSEFVSQQISTGFSIMALSKLKQGKDVALTGSNSASHVISIGLIGLINILS